MFFRFGLCAIACAIACDSSSSSKGGGNAAAGGETGSGGATPASAPASAGDGAGTCKPVDVCARFPLARVEKLCAGSGFAKTQPTNTVSDAYTLDACQYQRENGATVVQIERTCMAANGGGASAAGQMFQIQHDEKGTQDTVGSAAGGVGDKAYYRKQTRWLSLFVLKGNLLLTIASDLATPESEARIKDQCLLAIAKELTAL